MDRELIGDVYVDSGSVWVGDPCYTITGDASHHIPTWTEFCNRMFDDPNEESGSYSQPAGKGLGFAISTLDGDGSFPVYVEYKKNFFGARRPARIIIDFDSPVDEDGDDL